MNTDEKGMDILSRRTASAGIPTPPKIADETLKPLSTHLTEPEKDPLTPAEPPAAETSPTGQSLWPRLCSRTCEPFRP